MSFWRKRDEELQKEIDHYLRTAKQEGVDKGMSQRDAEAAARRELGNAGMLRELARDVWGWRWLEDFLDDLRYAVRMLLRSPGFSFIAIATMALGVGATTAIYSVIDATLLHPLPYPHPGELV